VSLRRRFLFAGLLFAAPLALGVIGLQLVEGIDPFDAFYQTIVTMATAGVAGGQAHTVAGKLLTIALLLLGGALLVYCASTVVGLALEGQLAGYFGGQRMRGRIEKLRDHFVVCGFGRVGEEVAAEFARRAVPFVVIESAPEIARRAIERGYLVIEGDATQDEQLQAAGVERARGLVAVSNSDANNTYITLSAKGLNPRIFVVARTSAAANERKLAQAGADRVISPYSIAGRHIALTAIQPLLVDVGATPSETKTGLVLAQIAVEEGSGHHGRTVGEILARSPNTTALGLHQASGRLLAAPAPDQLVLAGDELIVFGPEAELERILPAAAAPAGRAAETPA